MSERITDELRKFMRGVDSYELWCPHHKAELLEIADHIDAEHEKECREQYENGLNDGIDDGLDESFANVDDWLTQNEDAMAEHGWIRLPVDANNEYIHAGDVMDGYGKTIEVVELRYGRSGWVLISRDGNGYADTFAFVHHHEPTVDKLLDQLEGLRGNGADYEDVVTRASEIAEKIRELLKEDA